MTNKEIDKLLDMLDKKGLEQVKKYLNNEKEKNNKNEFQRDFEKYITNQDRNVSGLGKDGTVLNIRDDMIVFSNGISIYYVNNGVYNINSEKVRKGLDSYKGKHHIRKVYNGTIEKYEKALARLAGTELDFKDISETFEVPLTIEYIGDFAMVTYAIGNDLIEERFNLSEFKYADKILKEPSYKICRNNAILYGESEVGKVYILGRKRDSE